MRKGKYIDTSVILAALSKKTAAASSAESNKHSGYSCNHSKDSSCNCQKKKEMIRGREELVA